MCAFYGSKLPDKGTGAAAPGKPLDGFTFRAGTGGSDTLTRAIAVTGTDFQCYAKQPEYKFVGEGDCRDDAMGSARRYSKFNFGTISECRDLCTALSAACVGYDFAVAGLYAGQCTFYGSKLPDEGTGATAPGKPLDGFTFVSGNGGSDTLTRVNYAGKRHAQHDRCHAKQTGAPGMQFVPMSSPPHPVPSSHVLSPYRVPHVVLAR